MIRETLPQNDVETRHALYAGDIFLAAPTPASCALVDAVTGLVETALGPRPREAQSRLSPEDFFRRIGGLRRTVYLDPVFHDLTRAVIAGLGFLPDEIAFDPLRVRVVSHRGHDDPRAAAVYYPHRDIWYGHPPGLINWWMPLDDLGAHETFEFYPDYFCAPVVNDSAAFDYAAWVGDDWSLKIGWQDRDAGLNAPYPGIVGDPERGRRVGFSCGRAANLLFAGAHLHATLPQATGRSRFSVEFRAVHLGDHAAGVGAPAVDDGSRGSAVGDYLHPGQTVWPPVP